MKIVLPAALGAALLLLPQPVAGQPAYPVPVEGDFIARNVTFESGEVAPEIRLHYYDPSPHLAEITAPVLAINSADDFVNPPELPMMETLIKKVRNGRFVLVPVSDATRGHGTHSRPEIFGPYLAEFLKTIAR